METEGCGFKSHCQCHTRTTTTSRFLLVFFVLIGVKIWLPSLIHKNNHGTQSILDVREQYSAAVKTTIEPTEEETATNKQASTTDIDTISLTDIMNDNPILFRDICDLYIDPLLPNMSFAPNNNTTRILCTPWLGAIGHQDTFAAQIFFHQKWDLLAQLLKDVGDFIFVTVHGDLTPIGSASRSYLGGRLKRNHNKKKNHNNSTIKNTPNANPFLELDNLKHWFVPNALVDHPKIRALPIGINNKGKHKDTKRKSSLQQQQQQQQQQQDDAIILPLRLMPSPPQNHPLLLINFGRESRKKFGKERRYIQENIELWDSFATVRWPDSIASHNEYLALLKNATFVFSPPGIGWDCYRTYEAILVGTIPILLKTNTSFDALFQDLPVLLVDDYEQVTQAYLLDAYLALRQREPFRYDVLKISYWKQQILSLRDDRIYQNKDTGP